MCQSLHHSKMVFHEKIGKLSSQLNKLSMVFTCISYLITYNNKKPCNWAQGMAQFVKFAMHPRPDAAMYICNHTAVWKVKREQSPEVWKQLAWCMEW